MVLGSALAGGSPSHAWLFHGPAGTGKRSVAKAFAAELLADGQPDPDRIRARVVRDKPNHPDLTWVAPSGAHVMRVDDVEGPVVSAAGHTPFEAERRVFVLERVDEMNDEVANRLLKVLEEPPSYVHLVLITNSLGRVIDTVVSRCQLVRFDPLPAERIERGLTESGVPSDRARACARLARGSSTRGRFLASEQGVRLREAIDAFMRGVIAPDAASDGEAWAPLLALAESRQRDAGAQMEKDAEERLELEPKGRERKALEREFGEMGKRVGRRERTASLDLGLELAALGFRDLICLAEGVDDAVLATDTAAGMAELAQGLDPDALREAAELCEAARASLELNPSEELALTALTLRLRRLLAPA